MNFDIKKTFALIRGGLLSHAATWDAYLASKPDWKQTATFLTGPLIVLNVVLGLIFSRMVGGYATYGMHASFVSALVFGLVMAAVGFVVAVLVFNFLAGVFKGRPDFSRAFAAVSLAAIPAWIAGIVGALIPGVGFLVALAGGIVTLVFLYKIMPLALGVPADKRVVHFVVSLIAIFIVNLVIGMVFGIGTMRGELAGEEMLGHWEPQGQFMEAAGREG